MLCPNCGGSNPDNSVYCANCGAVLQGQQAGMQPQPMAPIPNYLVHAILVTIFCCLPFGIVAIVYAAQVDGKAAVGDYISAREASSNAKKWSLVALYCGLGVFVLWCLISGLMFLVAGTRA